MRILFLNQTFYPDPVATSQYLGDLARACVEQGHDVTVLTSRRAYENPAHLHPARETWCGIRILRVRSTGFGKKAKWRRGLDFASFFLAATFRAFFLPRADVVVALTTPPLISALGAFLAWVRGGRFIYWVMDLNPDEALAAGWLRAGSLSARGLEMISRWSLGRAHRVVVLDKYMQERLVAKGIAKEKVEVIPLWPQAGIAFNARERERFRREQGWEDACVIMYAGNHSPCHPLDPLLEVAEMLRSEPRFRFCFTGGGSEWPRLQAKARERALPNVQFLGYQPFSELSALLSAADVQVVVMGIPFVGLIHPSKIYNLLTTAARILYLGPPRSHVVDLLSGLGPRGMIHLPTETKTIAAELQQTGEQSGPLLESVPKSAGLEKWIDCFQAV